jgi:hypothetical protein
MDHEPRPAFECEQVVPFVRPAQWLVVAFAIALPLSLCAIAIGLGGRGTEQLWAVGLVAAVFGLFAWWRWVRRARPGTLRVDEHGVHFDGHFLVHRRAIASGLVVAERSLATTVRLVLRDGRVFEFRMPDVDGARLVLRTLGLDASRSIATFRAMGLSVKHYERRGYEFFAVALVSVLLMLGYGAQHPRAHSLDAVGITGLLAMMATWAWMAARLAWPTRVVVGGDGVSLRWMRREEFIPIADVRDAIVVEDDVGFRQAAVLVRITLRDGTTRDVPTVVRKKQSIQLGRMTYGDAIAIQERIAEVLEERAEATRVAEARRDLLPARTGSMPAWIASLRALASRPTTFREDARATADALRSTLDDASAAIRTRAAAAIALARDDDGKRRVAEVAEATAMPKLRAALEAAVRDDDAELEAVLAALEEEDEARAADRAR